MLNVQVQNKASVSFNEGVKDLLGKLVTTIIKLWSVAAWFMAWRRQATGHDAIPVLTSVSVESHSVIKSKKKPNISPLKRANYSSWEFICIHDLQVY